MNRTLVLHTGLQRALSPARVIVVFSIVTFPVLILSFAPQIGVQVLQSGAVLGLVLGAGLIGQDVSSGVVQLLFARPVTRAQYLVSRWFATGACAAAAALLQIGLGTATLALRGEALPAGTLAGLALEQALAAFGIVSVLTLFSSVLPGVGDIVAWIVLNVTGAVVQMVGGVMRSAWLMRAGQEWGGFLSPVPRIDQAFGGGGVSWFQLTSYASTVTLCLTLAIAILNRREFSYAND